MKIYLTTSFAIIAFILIAIGSSCEFKDSNKAIESGSDTSKYIFIDSEHELKCSVTFLPKSQIAYKYEHNRLDGCQFSLKGTGDWATIEYVKFGDIKVLPSDVYVSHIGKCVLFLKINRIDHTLVIIVPGGTCEDTCLIISPAFLKLVK